MAQPNRQAHGQEDHRRAAKNAAVDYRSAALTNCLRVQVGVARSVCFLNLRLSSLARRSICRRELGVGCGPDTGDAAACAEKQGSRSQSYECHQEGVLDQVLSLFVFAEGHDVAKSVCHDLTILPLSYPLKLP